LHGVRSLLFVVRPRGEVEIARALVIETEPQFLVPDEQSVLRVQSIVEPAADGGPLLRRRESLIDGNRIQMVIEDRRQDKCILIDPSVFRVERERCFALLQWTAQTKTVQLRAVRRPSGLREQGVPRVQEASVVLSERLAAERIGARLGEDLDTRK